MTTDVELIRFFCERKNITDYKHLLTSEGILTSEAKDIINDLEEYFRLYSEEETLDFDRFSTWSKIIKHSTWPLPKHEQRDLIMARASSVTSIDKNILQHFVTIGGVEHVEKICAAIKAGTAELTDLDAACQQLVRNHAEADDDVSELFGPTNLTEILDKQVRSDGLSWRLDSMNLCAGPLHGGDLVIVAGRPEAGKTSFLCSEITHMVKGLPPEQDAIIFNPEEAGGRLFMRLITAATDTDIITLSNDELKARADYEDEVGRMDRIKVVEPARGIYQRDVERILERGNVGLVGVNIFDKIRTRSRRREESEVQRRAEMAAWLRTLATRYEIPILAVVQAGGEAENQKWLHMGMLYNSKTGIQGEADLLVGVGYEHDDDRTRYVSILKNKLPGGPRTVPSMKHGKFSCNFSPETGRFYNL